MKILAIEDDIKIQEILRSSLTNSGYNVELVSNGEEGLQKTSQEKYDAIILDMMLPGIDGLSVLTKLRAKENKTPILILSAKQSVDDKVQGLKLGADDYMVKPFAVSELEVRIEALLRRMSPVGQNLSETKILEYEDLKMNLETREVTRGEIKIPLQVKEFSLLELLIRNPNKVMTKSIILEKIWGYDFDPQTNVVDVLVCRLRNKVDKDFQAPLIQTHRGVGYVLKKD